MALVYEVLSEVMGPYERTSGDNHVYCCPFCHHPKPKMNLKVVEGGVLVWHCWVCGVKGHGLSLLLDRTQASADVRQRAFRSLPKPNYFKRNITLGRVVLPQEAKNLYLSKDDSAQLAKEYLYRRGLNESDVIRYNIQFCHEGRYSRRVIIPSYDGQGVLSGFVSRSYLKNEKLAYLNSRGPRDFVFFDHLINWRWPVILCEGVFDAMAIGTNAIPLLGKRLSGYLRAKIWASPADRVYVALDADARSEAFGICRSIRAMYKDSYFVNLPHGDPSELGKDSVWKAIKEAEKFDERLELKTIIYGDNRRGHGRVQKKFRA